MKYTIQSNIPGRLRVRLGRYVLSIEECAKIEEYFSSVYGVLQCKVTQSIGSILIIYNKEIQASLIDMLDNLRISDIPPASEQLIEQKYVDRDFYTDIAKKVFFRYIIRPFLPMPIRRIIVIWNSLEYFKRAASSLMNGKINTSVLDASAIGASFYLGDFKTASSVMFLLSLSDSLEDYTKKRAHNALVSSLAVNVDNVWILDENSEEICVPLSQVSCGDTVIVRTGALIPIDGTVVSGEAYVNESSMTGEPLAVMRTDGSSVYAGTVIEEGELFICVKASADKTRINRIVSLIEESEMYKADIQSHAERLADSIVPYSFLGALGIFAATGNIVRALSVLMVDYSCALKLSTPISVISAMKEASDNKILVKGGKFFEEFAGADTIVFDKTGTLTVAKPTVSGIIAFKDYDRDYILQTAACLEEHFPHSVARSIVRKAEEEGLVHPEKHAVVEYVVAHGIASSLDNMRVLVGSAHFIFDDEGISISDEENAIINDASKTGCTMIYVAIGNGLAGAICIEDTIRPEAASVISSLRDEGFSEIIMITGDGEATAEFVAGELGIDKYYSQVLPEDKASIITELKNSGRRVVMVGDGVNDTPGLAAANVSVAMRDASDVAQGVADITLISADLSDLIVLRQMSSLLMKKISSNYRFIIGFNTSLLVLGQIGVLTPAMSALLHNVSTMGISAASMRQLIPKCSA